MTALAVVLTATTGPALAGDGVFGIFGKSAEEKERERQLEEIRKRARIVEKGVSGKRERIAASRLLPIRQLSPRDQQRVSAVLRDISVFRQLPTIDVDVDPRMYQFFVTHPDVAVSIWRTMKISEFEMTQTGPVTYDASAGDGTKGVLDVLYHTPREQVVLCRGTYKAGPLVRTINANCLLHLRSQYVRNNDGQISVRHRLNMFVSFPSTTVETAAKVFSPVSNMMVDRNFHEVSLFLHMMTVLSTERPRAIENISESLEGVSEPKREGLRRVSADIYARSRQSSPLRQTPPIPVSSVTPASGVMQRP